MRKNLQLLFTIMILSLGWSMTVCAQPVAMEDGTVFDAEFYAQAYPDVAAAYGTDASALYSHYLAFGRAEGRFATAAEEAAAEEEATLLTYLQVVEYTNICRRAAGQSNLDWDPLLAQTADLRALEASVLLAHTRPDGSSCFTALPPAYSYNAAGENLARGFSLPDQVVAAWMKSPTHRDNILDPAFTRLGVSRYVDEKGSLYWAQIFAG